MCLAQLKAPSAQRCLSQRNLAVPKGGLLVSCTPPYILGNKDQYALVRTNKMSTKLLRPLKTIWYRHHWHLRRLCNARSMEVGVPKVQMMPLALDTLGVLAMCRGFHRELCGGEGVVCVATHSMAHCEVL